MEKETVTKVQELQSPRQDKPKKEHAETHTDKTGEKKRKNIKTNMQKIIYKEIPIRSSADFLVETLQDRRELHDIVKVMKGKNLQLRLLYPPRPSFRINKEMKSFTDKQKPREFSTTKLTLQEMLKELL